MFRPIYPAQLQASKVKPSTEDEEVASLIGEADYDNEIKQQEHAANFEKNSSLFQHNLDYERKQYRRSLKEKALAERETYSAPPVRRSRSRSHRSRSRSHRSRSKSNK